MNNDDFLSVAHHVATGEWWVITYRPFGVMPVSGPYKIKEDAEEAMTTQAYRVRQGWKP